MKQIEFTADHVGTLVTHKELGKGKVLSIENGESLRVEFTPGHGMPGAVAYFNLDGSAIHDQPGNVQVLFIGHKVKFEMVEGGELPEPKLICPVCGVHHPVVQAVSIPMGSSWVFEHDFLSKCVFSGVVFRTKHAGTQAMENLVGFYKNVKNNPMHAGADCLTLPAAPVTIASTILKAAGRVKAVTPAKPAAARIEPPHV